MKLFEVKRDHPKFSCSSDVSDFSQSSVNEPDCVAVLRVGKQMEPLTDVVEVDEKPRCFTQRPAANVGFDCSYLNEAWRFRRCGDFVWN